MFVMERTYNEKALVARKLTVVLCRSAGGPR